MGKVEVLRKFLELDTVSDEDKLKLVENSNLLDVSEFIYSIIDEDDENNIKILVDSALHSVREWEDYVNGFMWEESLRVRIPDDWGYK